MFQLICIRLKFVGIQTMDKLEGSTSKESFARRLTTLLIFISWMIASMIHLFTAVVTFEEYADSFYTSVTAIGTGTYFAAFALNCDVMFRLMNNFDNFIEKRKLKYQCNLPPKVHRVYKKKDLSPS